MHNVSSEHSCTEDVIHHIEELMTEARSKNVMINAFISDSAGEYTAARLYLITN